MSRGGMRAASFAVFVAMIGAALPSMLQAQSSAAGTPTATPAAAPSTATTATDTKAKLRQAAGTATTPDPQSLKQAVKRAGSSAPAGREFDSDYSACGFLTKPAVRPDGGGLNSHKGGQVLCHQGRLMHCLAGRWRDRGSCASYGDRYPQAWQFEGSDPPGLMPTGGSPDAGNSGNPQNPDDSSSPGGPDGGGMGGGLTGSSPQSQQLESEWQELREREAEFNRQRGPQGGGNTTGQPGARQGPDAAKCAELRRTIAQADQAMKQFRDYSRSQRDDGQLSSDVRAAYNTIQSQRNQAQATLNQLGC